MSRCGPCSPASTRRTAAAFSAGSPPTSSSGIAGARPSATGSTRNDRTWPSSSASTCDVPGGGQLVEPVAVDHPRLDRAVDAQRREHPLGDGGVGDADQLPAHPAGVRHRSQQVEHGGDPDLLASRSGEAERRVVRRREAEPDAGSLDAAQHAPLAATTPPRRALRARRRCRTSTTRRARRACRPARRPPAVTIAAIVLTLIEWLRSPPVPTMSTATSRIASRERHRASTRRAPRRAAPTPPRATRPSRAAPPRTRSAAREWPRPDRMVVIATRACVAVRSRRSSSSVNNPGQPPCSCSSLIGAAG